MFTFKKRVKVSRLFPVAGGAASTNFPIQKLFSPEKAGGGERRVLGPFSLPQIRQMAREGEQEGGRGRKRCSMERSRRLSIGVHWGTRRYSRVNSRRFWGIKRCYIGNSRRIWGIERCSIGNSRRFWGKKRFSIGKSRRFWSLKGCSMEKNRRL